MKARSPTILIFVGITLLVGSGCASVGKFFHIGGADSGEEAEVSDDPVAAAAMRLRAPASTPIDASEERLFSRRYSPPAETISYGMGMNEVAAIWGEPSSIDSAGDPRSGNQRWTYYSGLSSRYGLGSKRIVYFENGHVAGWKN